MKPLSAFFADYARHPDRDAYQAIPHPFNAAAISQPLCEGAPELVNVGAGFWLWWADPARSVYRVTPATARIIAGTGMAFFPETPPEDWPGALVLESSGGHHAPFFRDVWSILAYHRDDKYFFVFLHGGAIGVFSLAGEEIRAMNSRAARFDTLLDKEQLEWDGHMHHIPAAHRAMLVDVARFAFAAHYYTRGAAPEVTATPVPGPPLRAGRKNKVVKKGGKPVFTWTYQDLRRAPGQGGQGEGRTPGREGLELSPVVVSPYFRRSPKGRVTLVGPHHSHRWTNPARAGKKKI